MGSEFGIFGGFGWVRSSVLVGELGFGRVRSSTSRVRSSSKLEVFSKMFIVVGFVGSEFGIFVGFGWVRSSVLVGELGFGRVRSSTSRVRSSSKLEVFSKMFIVVGFVGSEFGIFGGFGWVRSSVLLGKPGFARVRSSTSRVRSSSKFVIFGFDPTLVVTRGNPW